MPEPISRLIEKFAAQMEPAIAKAFLAAIEDIRSSAQISLIVGHLERGDVEAAIAALNLRPEFLAPLDDALRAAYLEGGRAALLALPMVADPFPASSRSVSTDEIRGPSNT